MIFYHGTTEKAAEKIQVEGLKPHRETRWKLKDDDGIQLEDMPGEDINGIYLTPILRFGVMFAMERAIYDRMESGEVLPGLEARLTKESKVVDREALPAVVVFDLSEDIIKKLQPDIQALSEYGTVCTCEIGPEHIKSVMHHVDILRLIDSKIRQRREMTKEKYKFIDEIRSPLFDSEQFKEFVTHALGTYYTMDRDLPTLVAGMFLAGMLCAFSMGEGEQPS